jgi:hypothetical protein
MLISYCRRILWENMVLGIAVVLFPTYDAPHYKYAYQMMIMFGVLAIFGTYLLDYLYKKEL